MDKRADPGFTPTERYLGKLARRTFLRLWSYQNLFTDRGVTETNRQGKELCDLLVVFGNDVIIFSDKACEIKDSGDVWRDWWRWYRKSIVSSASQIFGAERWIRSHPNRLFEDRGCTQPFKIPLPASADITFHRVAVASGVTQRCAAYFGNASDGTLAIDSSLSGEDHFDPTKAMPFCVGQISPTQGYVHAMDEQSLDTLLGELDTVTEFIQFLKDKEAAFSGPARVWAAGNQHWLGFYLANGGTLRNSFAPVIEELLARQPGGILITEGVWEDFSKSETANARKEAKEAGGFIDRLIEHFTGFVLSGTLAYDNGGGIAEQERNLRFLAAEPRLVRAQMSIAIGQKVATTPSNVRSGIVLNSYFPDRLFVFLLFPRTLGQTVRAFRQERHEVMKQYAVVARHLNPCIRWVVCLATEPGRGRQRSEDLMTFDFSDWSDSDDRNAAQIRDELNILKSAVHRGLDEPPNAARGDLSGNRRERRKERALRRKLRQ